MFCIELHGAFGVDNLRYAERATPEPKHGEVRIALKAAALNYRDLLMIRGEYNPRQPLPLIPGNDGAGVVEALGPGVTAWKLGDRVAPCFASEWIDGEPTRQKLRSTLGGPRDGTFATHIVLSERAIVRIPEHLSFEEAATLPCAAVTAWNALIGLSQLKASDCVLIQGTGGVSLFALQFAAMHGARTIVTSSSDEKLEKAKALGATHTLSYAKTKEWGRAAKQLAGGDGVDIVIEVGGAGTIDQSLKAVRLGGTVVLVGVLAGSAAPLQLTSVTMQMLRVLGIVVGSRANFEQMNQAITAHAMKPVIDRTFALKDTRAAFDHLASQKHFGKIVLTV